MTPYAKKFDKAYAKVLLRIAEGDLKTAKILAKHRGGRAENTVYIVQQAVEKALKSVLCHFGIPVPLTHDIAALLASLPSKIKLPPEEAALPSLTEFATVRRYEEGFTKVGAAEVRAALAVASKVIAWAKANIG